MSEKRNSGGPAFSYGDHVHGGDSGMTLRDWFAGQALAGLMASFAISTCDAKEAKDERTRKAKACYALADAMLAAREL